MKTRCSDWTKKPGVVITGLVIALVAAAAPLVVAYLSRASDGGRSTPPPEGRPTVPGRIAAVALKLRTGDIGQQVGPTTFRTQAAGPLLSLAISWTVLTENGELDDPGCYVEIALAGAGQTRADYSRCGDRNLVIIRVAPGRYQLTIHITTDWGDSATNSLRFTVISFS